MFVSLKGQKVAVCRNLSEIPSSFVWNPSVITNTNMAAASAQEKY